MTERYVGKIQLSPAKSIPAGGKPVWYDGEAVLTPSTTDSGASDSSLQAAAEAQGITHVSLHDDDPGSDGSNEIAGSRTAVTVAYSTGALRVVGDTDGAVDATGYSAEWCVAWAVTE